MSSQVTSTFGTIAEKRILLDWSVTNKDGRGTDIKFLKMEDSQLILAFASLELILAKIEINNNSPNLVWEHNIQPKLDYINGDTFCSVLIINSPLISTDSPFYAVAVKLEKHISVNETKYMLTFYHQTSSSDKKEYSIPLINE